MQRTSAQNRRLFGLLNKLGFDSEARHELIHEYTGGRTRSSSELTIGECNSLTGYLAHLVACKLNADDVRRDRLRKTLISFLYKLPDSFGFYSQSGDKKQFNSHVFDAFMMENKHSPYPGKRLNQLEIKELGRLIAIMKKWVEHYSKK